MGKDVWHYCGDIAEMRHANGLVTYITVAMEGGREEGAWTSSTAE